MAIVLDYKNDPELFNLTAQHYADAIAQTKPETKSTQIRNFYEFVLDLYERSEKEDFSEVLPFVKMLNSKVNYAKERKVVNEPFMKMLNECVNQISTKEQLRVFKLFFEAVIGFSKK